MNFRSKNAVAKLEKTLIENALRETDGNRTEAARKLKISRRLLYDKIKEFSITTEQTDVL